LCPEKENAIKNCRYQLLFGSPEACMSAKWQDMSATELYASTNLLGIVVDEVHLW